MTLTEALKSHKPFRRVGDKEWLNPWYATQEARLWHSEDVLAEWEIQDLPKPRVFLWESNLYGLWTVETKFMTEERAARYFGSYKEYRKSRLCPEGFVDD